jgi:hypothetical protein
MNSLSLPMMELADDLLARTAKLDPNEDRVLEDLVRALLGLRKRSLGQSIEYLRYLFEEAQEKGDAKASQYWQSMQQHLQAKQRLDRALGRYSSRSALAR